MSMSPEDFSSAVGSWRELLFYKNGRIKVTPGGPGGYDGGTVIIGEDGLMYFEDISTDGERRIYPPKGMAWGAEPDITGSRERAIAASKFFEEYYGEKA